MSIYHFDATHLFKKKSNVIAGLPYLPGGGGTLGISGWGCAAGTLEPLNYTRASSAEFCYPILEGLNGVNR